MRLGVITSYQVNVLYIRKGLFWKERDIITILEVPFRPRKESGG